MKIENVTIIGAGPAGIATAIQLKRFGITPLLLEKEEIGGLLKNASLVENYPGFPSGITGLSLVNLFRTHLKKMSLQPRFEEVIKLDLKKGIFPVETSKRVYYSRMVVVASGTKPREFTDFAIPEEVKEKIFCEIYPLFKVRKKKIAIVGAGDAAFDYALSLKKNNEVIILNREKKIKALPLLLERAKASFEISYHKNTRIFGIASDTQNGMLIECKSPKGSSTFRADYLVLAIGRVPQLDFLSERLKENAAVLKKTGILHFIGDVKNGDFRQTVIAAGDGIMAAMKMCRRLKEVCE